MKETKKLTINFTDLDHILDVDMFLENRDTPPSRLFVDSLKREMEINGMDLDREFDVIEIVRR